jgi:hypothetical protein
MSVNTKQAIWIWGKLNSMERVIVNVGFMKNNMGIELKDAGCTLRINTCLSAKDFPMKKRINELIGRYNGEIA